MNLKQISEAFQEAQNCGYEGTFLDYCKKVGVKWDLVDRQCSTKTLPKKEESP